VAVKCPKCDTDNPSDSKYCKECAAPLPSREVSVTETLETPTEELTRGTIFASRYEIIEELGKGGMGKVYRVEDKKIKEEVALKLIKPEIASDKKTIERFRSELKIARKIRHKNVCGMYDLDEEKGIHYITMEYVPGEDLKGSIRRMGPLTAGKTLFIAKQICEGLAEAHRLGVVHRDLKPQNIMIDKEGNARIMDFGIARSIKAKSITGAGVMVGTPEYMSPEQAEVKEVDQRSDIYSLGVVLYEMVTGRVPFEGETPLGIAMKHKSEMPKDPRELNVHIPEDLSRVILRCMKKDKEKRFQSAGELRSELNVIEKSIPATERIVPKRKPITSREITVKFDLKKVFISAIIIIFLIAIAGYFLLRPGRVDTDIEIGTTKQITYEPGLEIDPNISPDGKMVAFVVGPLGKTRLVVRQVAGGRQIEITKDFPGNQRWPQWSPDSTQIAFYSEGSIYVVPSLGGIPKRIINSIANSSAHSPAWSPDGKKIAYVQNDSICIFYLNTGASEKILEASEVHCLSWSPDGSQIVYVSGNLSFVFSKIDLYEALFATIGNIAPSSIYIASLPRRTTVRVTNDDYLNVSPFWTPDGKNLLFISNRGGTRDIYAVPLISSGTPSGPPTRLTTGLDAHTMSISKQGQKLAYSVFNYKANVRSIEIPEKDSLSIAYSKPITKGNQIVETVDVSRNGKWLVYGSNLSGNMDIYKMPVAGGDAIQLTTHPSDDFVPRWSPDGEKIAFHSFRQGNRDIYCMTKDGESIIPLTDYPSHEFAPHWSSDGSKIVFFSGKTGRTELYVISRKDTGWGEPEQITFDGGIFPQWSPVDNSIAYISEDGLRIISYDDRKTKTLVKSQDTLVSPGPRFPTWSLDGKKIYYMALDDKGNGSIWSVSIKGGEPELKIIFDDPQLSPGMFNISADDQRLYFSPRENESNVWIMDLISRDK